MVQNVSAASAASTVALSKLAQQQAKAAERAEAKAAKAAAKAATKAPVPTIAELNQRATYQRSEIAAGLYDRSLTLNEGARTLRRQEAIQAYAAQLAQQPDGPSDADLRKLSRRLDNAQKQIDKLQTNDRGANLASLEGIDGKDLDIVQDNLLARIQAGINDGSLTKDEAETLLARQAEIAAVEEKLRASDGKLTAGEQKTLLDDLRKTADQINAARHNAEGINVATINYAERIDKRQEALEKQLAEGVKAGSITSDEADQIRAAFDAAQKVEDQALANGKVDWRENLLVDNALNDVEIKLYDLQRNNAGLQLKDVFVDEKYIDQRQAAHLEGITRGIDRGWLTNEEAESLLTEQNAVDKLQEKLNNSGLTRAEYLQLQTALNNASLHQAELNSNKERYTGLFPGQNGGSTNAGGSTGAGNGSSNAGGSTGAGNGSSNAGGSTGAGNGSSNAGGSTGTGNGSAPVEPVPQPPVTQPPVEETKAEETQAEETKPAETKPEETKAEEAKPAVATEENAQPVLKALDAVKDRFGEWVTGMMRERTSAIRDLHESFRSHAEKLREDLAERDEKRREANRLSERKAGESQAPGLPVGDAEIGRKVGAYRAAIPAGEVPSSTLKKVA